MRTTTLTDFAGQKRTGMLELGDATPASNVVAGNTMGISDTRNGLVVASGPFTGLDLADFASAAKLYDFSPDPKDHVFVRNPGVLANIPNRKLVAFPLERCRAWSHLQGRMLGHTLRGVPSCIDHPYDGSKPMDPHEGLGVVLHTEFTALHTPITERITRMARASGHKAPEFAEIQVVQSFCRQKKPDITQAILDGKRNAYSIAALVYARECPICDHVDTGEGELCEHLSNMGRLFGGKLAYARLLDWNFVEHSNLAGNPANSRAYGSVLSTQP